MKVAIFSDLHFGVENYGHKTENGIHSRFYDFKKVYEDFIKDCIEKEVDLVLFGGDAFKNRTPQPYQLFYFMRGIDSLIRNEIQVMAVEGNHDKFKTKGYTGILKVLEFTGADVITETKRISFHKNGERLDILFLPYEYEPDFKVIDKKIGLMFNNIDFEESDKVIGLGHFGVSGAKLGSEQDFIIGSDEEIPRELLTKGKRKEIDWYMGHYHRKQEIGDNIFFIGSMNRVNFNEIKGKKGWYLLDTEKDTREFIENDIKEMYKIEIHNDEIIENAEGVIKTIDNNTRENSILWVKIDAKKENKIRAFSFRKEIENYFRNKNKQLAKVDIETENRINKDFKDVELSNINEELKKGLKEIHEDKFEELINEHREILEEL